MCTSSGRKAAQEGLSAEQRRPGRMQTTSKFVGGQAALYKQVSVSGAYKKSLYDAASRDNDRLGAEAGGTSISPEAYGGTSRDSGGEANNTEISFSGSPSQGVSGGAWTGASGRTYRINRSATDMAPGGEAGGYEDWKATYSVGKKQAQPYGVKDQWNVGSVSGGVDIGKTEDEARKTYADFGMDFDKDKYRGDFYKNETGLAPGQRTNLAAKEGAKRKVNRIRNKGGPNAAAGNARRDAKKQGNLRISSAGIQGGSSGGGTTLS